MAKNQLIFRTKKAVYLPIENIKNQNLYYDTPVTIANFTPGTDGSVIKAIKFKVDFSAVYFLDKVVLQLTLTENGTTTVLHEEEVITLDFTRNLITEISTTVDDNNKPYLALESGQVLTLKIIPTSTGYLKAPSTGYIQAENY